MSCLATRSCARGDAIAAKWHFAICALGPPTDADAVASHGETSFATSATSAKTARSRRKRMRPWRVLAPLTATAPFQHVTPQSGLLQAFARCQRLKNQLRDIYVTVARHASGIPRGIRRRRRLRADVFASFIRRDAACACLRRAKRHRLRSLRLSVWNACGLRAERDFCGARRLARASCASMPGLLPERSCGPRRSARARGFGRATQRGASGFDPS